MLTSLGTFRLPRLSRTAQNKAKFVPRQKSSVTEISGAGQAASQKFSGKDPFYENAVLFITAQNRGCRKKDNVIFLHLPDW
jgi:hypothetical protein